MACENVPAAPMADQLAEQENNEKLAGETNGDDQGGCRVSAATSKTYLNHSAVRHAGRAGQEGGGVPVEGWRSGGAAHRNGREASAAVSLDVVVLQDRPHAEEGLGGLFEAGGQLRHRRGLLGVGC